jgi:hypothetical protein
MRGCAAGRCGDTFFYSVFSACGGYVTIFPKLTGGSEEIFCDARILVSRYPRTGRLMKGFSHASQAAPAPPPRLCEVCGDMMRIRSITFTPKGSEISYRCRQREAVALEIALPIKRGA